MRHKLLELLRCINCKDSFELKVFNSTNTKYNPVIYKQVKLSDWKRLYQEDIEEGILICNGCNRVYPIINFIPRILPNILSAYPDFCERYSKELQDWTGQDFDDYLSYGLRKTQKGFGYEWLNFNITSNLENTLKFFLCTGIDPRVYQLNIEEILDSKSAVGDLSKTISDINYKPNGEFLKNKLILDAGCGMGRYLEVANKFEDEVVGIDISPAVDRARKRIGDHPFTHLVQGDLTNLPFKKSIFDYIYCIFVIQHAPDPPKTFKHLIEFIKEGCQFSLTVYEKSNYRVKDLTEILIRKVTTRLPVKLLHILSYMGIPLGWLQNNIRKYPILRVIGFPFLLFYFGGHPNWRIRLTDTFDCYIAQYQFRYSKDEIKQWFDKERFINIQFAPWDPNPAGIIIRGDKAVS